MAQEFKEKDAGGRDTVREDLSLLVDVYEWQKWMTYDPRKMPV